jgi:hypothetical protein
MELILASSTIEIQHQTKGAKSEPKKNPHLRKWQ